MECSVRYVREEDQYGIVTSSLRPALCFRGRKVVHAVISDETRVRVLQISTKQCDKAAIVQYHGGPYDPTRYRDRLLLIAKTKPITQRAVALLERPEIADEDNLPPDEPTEDNRAPVRTVEPTGIDSPGVQAVALPELDALFAVPNRARAPKQADRPKLDPQKLSVNPKCPVPFKKAEAKQPDRTAKVTLVGQLAAELGMQPQPLRVLLRAAGLRAPYNDIDAMRKALKK